MNAIVVINTENQNKSLYIAFEASLGLKGWEAFSYVENTFIKNFESNESTEVKALVREDIQNAVVDADWKPLKYITILSNTIPTVEKTN